jgi:hypothetical protein
MENTALSVRNSGTGRLEWESYQTGLPVFTMLPIWGQFLRSCPERKQRWRISLLTIRRYQGKPAATEYPVVSHLWTDHFHLRPIDTVSQAYFALHKTLHEVENFQEKKIFGTKVTTSEAFLRISQNSKFTGLQRGTQTKL